MVKESEGVFKVDGTELFTKTWLPDEDPLCKLIFVHGYSDHMGRYYGFFPYLASRGIAVYGFDQRGWGRSVRQPGDKGKSGPTSQVVGDIAAFVRKQLPSPVPVFVMGHSMGGGEVLTLASDAAYEADVLRHVRGWLLEAPFIGWPEGGEPGWLKIKAGRLVGRLLPHRQMVNILPPETLVRDPEVVKSLTEDTLCHNTGTLEGLAGMLDRTEELRTGRAHLNRAVKSVWLGHGTEDKGTSYRASKEWAERHAEVKDLTFKTYEGHFHQLHAEPNKEEFYKDVADWILERVGDAEAVKAAQATEEVKAPEDAKPVVVTDAKL